MLIRLLRWCMGNAYIYDCCQWAIGADNFREFIAGNLRDLRPGARVLDIGCGTARILSKLGDVDYVGVDVCAAYIESAQRAHPLGRFVRMGVETRLTGLGRFDLVMALGVLHHLDDTNAAYLFSQAAEVLHPHGRIFTIDPCFMQGQSFVAKALVSYDRGQYVRAPQAYLALGQSSFPRCVVSTRSDLLRVPYSHAIVTASQEGA